MAFPFRLGVATYHIHRLYNKPNPLISTSFGNLTYSFFDHCSLSLGTTVLYLRNKTVITIDTEARVRTTRVSVHNKIPAFESSNQSLRLASKIKFIHATPTTGHHRNFPVTPRSNSYIRVTSVKLPVQRRCC